MCGIAGILNQESTSEVRELALRQMLALIRHRADVPVAAYLSGGLDSAVIAALARQVAPGRLCTFGEPTIARLAAATQENVAYTARQLQAGLRETRKIYDLGFAMYEPGAGNLIRQVLP